MTENFDLSAALRESIEAARLRRQQRERCGSDIAHRDDGHRQSVCIKNANHRDAHSDGAG